MYRRQAAVRAVTEIYADGSGTFARRIRQAMRAGYEVRVVEPSEHEAEILAINRSIPERQGRRMDASYWDRVPSTGKMAPVECPRHHARFYGVFTGSGRMVAYASIQRCGEFVVVSQILGHGEHMDDGIMYLLMQRVFNDAYQDGPGLVYYNVWDSGTDGLRFFKARLGLEPRDLDW
jgi:hypothetical protein